MKTCTKCGTQKPLSEFHNRSRKPDGKFASCKQCRNAASRAARAATDQSAEYQDRIARVGVEAEQERRRAYYQENKDKIKEKTLEWSKNNGARKKQNSARHYEENKAIYIEKSATWARENRNRRTQICIAYMDRKREENPREYVAAVAARKMLSRILAATGRKKSGRTFDVLGYNRQQFDSHLESLFLPGMTWANHGEWHIDHIIPLSELIRCGVTDPAKINALANLRPMWAADNISKHDSFELAPPEASSITRAAKCHRTK